MLFYRPASVSGTGATSLSLGGELFVNGGRLTLGQASGSMAIGNERTQAVRDAAAIGHGAQASGAFGMAVGYEAKNSGVNSHAFAGKPAPTEFAPAWEKEQWQCFRNVRFGLLAAIRDRPLSTQRRRSPTTAFG